MADELHTSPKASQSDVKKGPKPFVMPAMIKCKACQATVYPMDQISVDGIPFHKQCLKCSVCQRVLSLGQYASLNGQYFCKPHFKQSFKTKGNYKFTDASSASEETSEPGLGAASSPLATVDDKKPLVCSVNEDAC